MGTVRTSHRLDTAAIKKILRSSDGPVARDLLSRGFRVESAAKRNLSADPKRINTGYLRSKITHGIFMTNSEPRCRIGTNVKYAIYVHSGTGLYGPSHRLIVPVRKKALRWKGRGKKGYVFSKKSRGMRPNPFLENALRFAKK